MMGHVNTNKGVSISDSFECEFVAQQNMNGLSSSPTLQIADQDDMPVVLNGSPAFIQPKSPFSASLDASVVRVQKSLQMLRNTLSANKLSLLRMEADEALSDADSDTLSGKGSTSPAKATEAICLGQKRGRNGKMVREDDATVLDGCVPNAEEGVGGKTKKQTSPVASFVHLRCLKAAADPSPSKGLIAALLKEQGTNNAADETVDVQCFPAAIPSGAQKDERALAYSDEEEEEEQHTREKIHCRNRSTDFDWSTISKPPPYPDLLGNGGIVRIGTQLEEHEGLVRSGGEGAQRPQKRIKIPIKNEEEQALNNGVLSHSPFLPSNYTWDSNTPLPKPDEFQLAFSNVFEQITTAHATKGKCRHNACAPHSIQESMKRPMEATEIIDIDSINSSAEGEEEESEALSIRSAIPAIIDKAAAWARAVHTFHTNALEERSRYAYYQRAMGTMPNKKKANSLSSQPPRGSEDNESSFLGPLGKDSPQWWSKQETRCVEVGGIHLMKAMLVGLQGLELEEDT